MPVANLEVNSRSSTRRCQSTAPLPGSTKCLLDVRVTITPVGSYIRNSLRKPLENARPAHCVVPVTMKIAYLDCLSGISGDMTLGALIDAGVDPATIQAGIDYLSALGGGTLKI